MLFSHTLGELAKALSAAQGEFGAVPKEADNPFFKSKYADLAAVVKVASPVLAKYGLSVSQFPGVDEHGDTLTTILLHSSGEFVESTMRLRPVKPDPQSLGSAITYGRRYAYMSVLGLVADEDDDGNAASHGKAPRRNATAPQQHSEAAPALGGVSVGTSGPSRTRKPPAPAGMVSSSVAKSQLIGALELVTDPLRAKELAVREWGERGNDPIDRSSLEAMIADAVSRWSDAELPE